MLPLRRCATIHRTIPLSLCYVNPAILSSGARATGTYQSTTSLVDPATMVPPPKSLDDAPFMERLPNRQLPPDHLLSNRRRWLRTIPIFIAIVTASALGIFNYQKLNSPIVSSTLYALRTHSRARQVLGDEVYFASRVPWIWGQINLVQGRVDVRFRVKGTRGTGMVRFRARREGGRSGVFKTYEWSLTSDESGEVLQLLQSSALDPLLDVGT